MSDQRIGSPAKIFTVTLTDALRFKQEIHVEAWNRASLDVGLNATLGVSGCEIISIEEYLAPSY